jgi:hypothetical protein
LNFFGSGQPKRWNPAWLVNPAVSVAKGWGRAVGQGKIFPEQAFLMRIKNRRDRNRSGSFEPARYRFSQSFFLSRASFSLESEKLLPAY